VEVRRVQGKKVNFKSIVNPFTEKCLRREAVNCGCEMRSRPELAVGRGRFPAAK
jgi:hypothetical protein